MTDVLEPEAEVEVEILNPTYLGPTWAKNEDGSWHLPEHTLGWDIIGWCGEFLGSLTGEEGPCELTPEQMRFVLWWYAIDKRGNFSYRTGVLQRLKGWGKDPLLAVLCLVELCGPSRFSHWSNGEAVGKAHPQAWVQVAAVSREQTKNTMTMVSSLITDHLRNTYGVDAGKELIRARGNKCRLEAVTSSYRSLEGNRPTFILLNETHHWISGNGGHDMYATIDGNATKVKARYLAITNAYLPGEDSVAERMRDAYDKATEGITAATRFLYDSIEAHPKTGLDPESLRWAVPLIRGDAYWLDVDDVIDSVMNGTFSPARSRRMWLNQIVSQEDALYDLSLWAPLAKRDALKKGDEIVMGFDGGKTDDATALVAIRVRDSMIVPLGIWEKPDGPSGDGWEINRAVVDSRVRWAMQQFTVRGFYCDVALWESHIIDWTQDYGDLMQCRAEPARPLWWDMRGSQERSTRAHERLAGAIFDAKLSWSTEHHVGSADVDLSKTLQRHVLNVNQHINKYGMSFRKSKEARKIDAYAALMLAHEALTDYRTGKRKVTKKARPGRGYFM